MSQIQREALDQMLRNSPAATGGSIEQARAGYAAFMGTMVVPDGIATTEGSLAGIRSLVAEKTVDSRPGTILFFHGGAYVLGSPETELCLSAGLTVRTGVMSVSPEYRLAPEHPFPAAVDDAFSAYQALLDEGRDPESIAFAGDSAGGGLVISTLLRAKSAGLPMPAAAVAFSPGLDATRSGESMRTKHGIDPIFTRDGLNAFGALYLGGADPRQELLSPATMADPSGFPPLLLQAGSNEVLLDDSVRMAERARNANVDVTLDITAGVPHVFQTYAGRLDEADQALYRAALFISQHLS